MPEGGARNNKGDLRQGLQDVCFVGAARNYLFKVHLLVLLSETRAASHANK